MLSIVRRWVEADLAPWRGRGFTAASLSAQVDLEVSRHGQTFRFDVSPRAVVRRPRSHGPHAAPAYVAELTARAALYEELLRESLPLAGLRRSLPLALDVGDIPPDTPDLPLFAFQRRRGAPTLLLPDMDLLEFGFLEAPHWRDPLPFRGSRSVVFELPRVVQCDGPQTEAQVRALGFGSRTIPWAEQMGYRHLLSIDGNGATCSRVAIALHSNSTLLKYASPYELFYFRALEPWRHYVPIEADEEVEAVVADSERDPRRYAAIARAGRRLFRTHLTRTACRRYVALLLRGYAGLLDEAGRDPAAA